MKKISFLICTLFMLFTLVSCRKQIYKSYDIGEEELFINEIYKCIDDNKNNYCLIDVRDLNNEYGLGHFRGFINYDINKGSADEFVYKISSMYSKDKIIFMIDSDGSVVEILQQALKEEGYKKIYIYLGGYQKLLEKNDSDFVVVTGIDDCGC